MNNPHLQAGFAEVDINPPLHLSLAGKFFPRPIQRVLDPLFAHAMVFESGATRAVLISCDLLACSGRLVEEVRNDVQEELGIPASHIAVFVTHTPMGNARRERISEQRARAPRPIQLSVRVGPRHHWIDGETLEGVDVRSALRYVPKATRWRPARHVLVRGAHWEAIR